MIQMNGIIQYGGKNKNHLRICFSKIITLVEILNLQSSKQWDGWRSYDVCFDLFFYGISTLAGYLMQKTSL